MKYVFEVYVKFLCFEINFITKKKTLQKCLFTPESSTIPPIQSITFRQDKIIIVKIYSIAETTIKSNEFCTTIEEYEEEEKRLNNYDYLLRKNEDLDLELNNQTKKVIDLTEKNKLLENNVTGLNQQIKKLESELGSCTRKFSNTYILTNST